MSTLTLRRAVLMALATTITAAYAKSEAALPNVELDPVVVTVSRTSESLSNTPAAVTVINKKEIAKNPTQNLSDVLQKDAGIYIKQTGGIGQGTEISLRGGNVTHTLYLKDGIRLNTPNTFTPVYTEQLDLVNAARIEVAKGPASVQYGSDAINGVVQVISNKPTTSSFQATHVTGEHASNKTIVAADVVHQGFYTSVSGQRFKTDGTRIFNTQGRNKEAAFEQQGASATIGYHKDGVIDASVSHDRNDGINTYSSDDGASNSSNRHFKNTQSKAQVQFHVNDKLKLSAHHARAVDKQKYIEPWSTNNYNTNHQQTDINARLALMNNQNILVGATQNKDTYSDAYAYKGEKTIKTTGYYAQHQYNSDKLNTQVGVRVEDNEKFGTHTVGQAAARLHVSPSTSVYANIGSAFRAPSLNELYYIYENEKNPTWNTYGNEKLQPEKAVTYELGIDQKFGENLTASLAAYRTDVRNLIATKYNTEKQAKVYENLNKAQFTGGELGLKYARNDYYAKAQYAYTKSENKDTNLPIAYRAKHTGTLTVGFDNGDVGVSTSAVARSKVNAENKANPVTVPGYVTVDVDAYWQINPYVKLFTNIKNIANSEHKVVYNFGNWYVNGGRQANLGLTFSY